MAHSRHQTARTVVVVGQDGPEASSLRQGLLDRAESVRACQTVAAALDEARLCGPDLAFLLADVPHDEAVRFLRELQSHQPACRVVVLSRRPTVEAAVQLLRAGAYDYAACPLAADALDALFGPPDAPADAAPTPPAARDSPERFFCEDCPPGVPIVGHGRDIVQALRALRRVAESPCNTILLTGETGTGKELAARAVHAWRGGTDESFVAVNCAALTANLLESELFGHVKGAFTGAHGDKPGLLELAGEGTVFLDEISEMPRALQAKLLRVLQERTFRRVGGTETLRCRATIIASSNRDLAAEVKAGTFRRDLYYRLAVFPIHLAPLRSAGRRQDVPLLAAYFIEHSLNCPRDDVRGLTAAAQDILQRHDWPGNVRELRNVIDRALILEATEWITADSIVFDGQAESGQPPARAGEGPPKDFSLETAEREFILRALKETGWQRTRAAALLGITRATLHAKLKRYGIQPPEARKQPKAVTGTWRSDPAPQEATA